MSRLKLKKSFTLMELMVVVVIVGIIATLALTTYTKTMRRAREREAITNLFSIYGAARVYKIKHGTYPTQDLNNLTEVNQTLELNLVSSDATTYKYYLLNTVDTHKFLAKSPEGWEVHFHDLISYIHCGAGPACPTCSYEAGPGCGNISNY